MMTMMGVILTVVLSGAVSLFISYRFLRKRMGLGMAVMFLLPAISCGTYIYFTAPRFNQTTTPEPLADNEKHSYAPPASSDEITELEAKLEEKPDDPDALLALSGAYMSREEYDKAISLLETSKERFAEENIKMQLATTYFAKGLLFAEKGNFTSALENLRKAQEIAPEEALFLADLEHFINMIEGQLAAENSEN